MTSATSAFAFGDDNGRYQVIVTGLNDKAWVVIDTQTGKTRWCWHYMPRWFDYVLPPMCGPWSVPEEYNLWPSDK